MRGSRRCWRLCAGRRGRIAGGCGVHIVRRVPVRVWVARWSSYSCFMCSSARRASSGPMVFLVIAKDSELMLAVLLVFGVGWLVLLDLVGRSKVDSSRRRCCYELEKFKVQIYVRGSFNPDVSRHLWQINTSVETLELTPFVPRSSSSPPSPVSRCTGQTETLAALVGHDRIRSLPVCRLLSATRGFEVDWNVRIPGGCFPVDRPSRPQTMKRPRTTVMHLRRRQGPTSVAEGFPDGQQPRE